AGYLPQQRASVADLRLCGRDFVASALRGERWGLPLADRAARSEVQRAIAAVESEALAARPLCQLSGGELQRLLLAQALLGKPKRIFTMLEYDFMRTAFMAGGLVAIVAGSVGFFLVLRHLTFAGHALSHVGFAGATGSVLIGVNPLWGMLAFTVAAGTAMGLL